MSSIRETVEEGLNQRGLGSYARDAAPIVSALEEREANIASQLVDFAAENGLSRTQAGDMLVNLGMTMKIEAVRSEEDPRIAAAEAAIESAQALLRDLRG